MAVLSFATGCFNRGQPGCPARKHVQFTDAQPRFRALRPAQHRQSRPSLQPAGVLSLTATNALTACATLSCISLCCLVLAAPRWRWTQQLMRSHLALMPAAICYTVLLWHSWSPDSLSLILPGSLKEGFSGGFKPQFLPRVQGIVSLFSRPATAASLWVHLLAINMFLGRTVYLEGIKCSTPFRHSFFLSFILGPLGLISHQATVALGFRV